MEDVQPTKTSSVDARIADFIILRDLLKDSYRYLQNRIDSRDSKNTDDDDDDDNDLDQLVSLSERSREALRLVNELIQKCSADKVDVPEIDDLDENASYLDMSRGKYESYDLTKPSSSSNRNDYVDVTGKLATQCADDDNIYDNYSVERNGKCGSTVKDASQTKNQMGEAASSKKDCDGKLDCPFNGLPAAHLTIVHSPKVGWLTMHLRHKRFIRKFSMNFKRKYYTGLVSKQTDRDYYEWWLLMYAGGTSDLKPTICLPLNRFHVIGESSKITKTNEKQPNQDDKRIQCKFELNEKHPRKDANSYCFVAETAEHCEHWVNLLKQLSAGLPYVETIFTTTAQIRKLPMLPLNAKATESHNCMSENVDTVDTMAVSHHGIASSTEHERNSEIDNYSEGVYEEPEEYYKNVPATAMNRAPTLPQKKISQPSAIKYHMDDSSTIYDTPKKPIRIANETKHYDLVAVKRGANDNCTRTDIKIEVKTIDSPNDARLKIGDEIRCKLSTQLKDKSQKYLSNASHKAGDEEMIKTTTVESIANKYQLSTVRKWFFSSHLAKLRQSTNPTNFIRRSSGDKTTDTTDQSTHSPRLKKTNAIAPTSDVQKQRAFSVQPKGNKVHMIINQLEANGQLTLLSGGASTNKCTTPMFA